MILLLLFLLVFHQETILGTKQGLLLWYQTLIPSLLPFILVTNALSETNAYQAGARFLQQYFSDRVYEWMAIVLGNLCGYPIGGKLLNDFVKNQYVSTARANRILAFASQASPMFLLGYVHLHILKNVIPLPVFLTSIYVPVLAGYLLCSTKAQTGFHYGTGTPAEPCHLSDTFLHAVQIMVMIGIYVIIFSILLNILLPCCDHTIPRAAMSFLEITTGLKLLESLVLPAHIKTALLCALSAFGGLCSAFQIRGVLDYPGADIKIYLLDKVALSAGTFFIILFYLQFL